MTTHFFDLQVRAYYYRYSSALDYSTEYKLDSGLEAIVEPASTTNV